MSDRLSFEQESIISEKNIMANDFLIIEMFPDSDNALKSYKIIRFQFPVCLQILIQAIYIIFI